MKQYKKQWEKYEKIIVLLSLNYKCTLCFFTIKKIKFSIESTLYLLVDFLIYSQKVLCLNRLYMLLQSSQITKLAIGR